MEFRTTTFIIGTPGHSWQTVACSGMSIGHKSLIFAGKTIAGSAIELLTEPDLLKKVQNEFKDRLLGRIYKCPIPDDVKPPIEVAKAQAARAQAQIYPC